MSRVSRADYDQTAPVRDPGSEVIVEISGEYRFKAPIDVVWRTLFDPDALRASIPGCESLREAAPGVHAITARVGVSVVKGQYSGEVRVVEAERPTLYRLAMNGNGGPGDLQGQARIDLQEAPGGTLVKYSGDLRAQGALARVGGQVLSGAAKLMIGQFFKEMERQVRERTP